jgi:hypothetical protein
VGLEFPPLSESANLGEPPDTVKPVPGNVPGNFDGSLDFLVPPAAFSIEL